MTASAELTQQGIKFTYDTVGVDFTYLGNVKVQILTIDGVPVMQSRICAAYTPYEDISTTPSTFTDTQGVCKAYYDKIPQKDQVGNVINYVIQRGKTYQVILVAIMLDGSIDTGIMSFTTEAPLPVTIANPFKPIKIRP